MSTTLDLPIAQPDHESMDDTARFRCPLTEKELDAAIESMNRMFDVEILRAGVVVAVEKNVSAQTGLAAVQKVASLIHGNYGFRIAS